MNENRIRIQPSKFFLILAALPLAFLGHAQIGPITGSWGDQGDGTYKNPILNADYPDVDVEQLGDTYYMISSKQHMSPGMVILESKDMVNWTSIGHVWDSLSWAPEYNWDRMNGYSFGVWAGDLAYHDGKWYCYQIDFKHGLYVSTAANIRGPWSAPHQMLPTDKVLDDPGVFWDEEAHQAYLICNTSTKQKSPDNKVAGNENRLYKMSWDGMELQDAGQVIYTGVGAEAAKIYKFNGQWYILMAEWFNQTDGKQGKSDNSDRDRKQIVLRSKTKSIYGPYEKRIILQRGNGIVRSCSQGAFMQAPDKSWWYTHQLIQNIESPFQGRPQCLEPVTWVDGWPIIGKDINGDGIGEPVLQYKKPIQGLPVTAPATDDDFLGIKLGPQWEWNHNPRNTHWSVTERPGWLRLKASLPLSLHSNAGPGKNIWTNGDGAQSIFWRACNTVSQRIMGITTGTATARLDISGMAPGQRAGFVRFGGVYHLLGIKEDESNKRYLFYMDQEGIETKGPGISGNQLFIRTSNSGDKAFFEYSMNDKTYQRFGPEFTLKFGKWTGDRLGFFCWNEKEEKGYIDIDWFKYDYDGPKIAPNQWANSDTTVKDYRDLYSDTWVASDALGRTMPDFAKAGPVKTDKQRVVSIFYITWHTRDKHKESKIDYTADVTKVLLGDPAARLDANHPLWKDHSYHWGEPEMGYFLSQDEYVIRKDMSMLADAGVDVLIMDVTNAVRYWDEWEVTFTTMQKMKAEGNKVPQFCFWAFNGPVITVVQDLYDRIYKTNRFKGLWFYWDGKPLLLYNGTPKFDANGKDVKQKNPHFDAAAKTDVNHPHYGDPDYSEEFYKDYTKDVKKTFTLRTMWWGYYQWAGQRFVGTEDNWSFGYDLGNEKVKTMNPDDLVSIHNGKKEEAAVTPAQHPSSLVGKSWRRETGEPALNQYDMVDSAYVPWLGKTVKNPEGYGIYFQDRWEEALKTDPEMLYINDWNEWTAGKYPPKNAKFFPFMRRESSYFFVDQYNAEFNRCVQPMKDGYTDNYYMQMAQNIRRYKGIRPIPVQKGITTIKIDGQFGDWKNIVNEFRDTNGDVIHRDFNGYGGLHYTNESGRNDILTGKIAVDNQNVNFYVETAGKLTSSDGNNWMLLLVDADNNPETGWFGYDFLINKSVKSLAVTTLMRYDRSNPDKPWKAVSDLKYGYSGNALEVAIPRKLLGLKDNKFTFDFKWSDNPADLKDPISLCTNGDTAPNRRFNYRCIWEK